MPTYYKIFFVVHSLPGRGLSDRSFWRQWMLQIMTVVAEVLQVILCKSRLTKDLNDCDFNGCWCVPQTTMHEIHINGRPKPYFTDAMSKNSILAHLYICNCHLPSRNRFYLRLSYRVSRTYIAVVLASLILCPTFSMATTLRHETVKHA